MKILLVSIPNHHFFQWVNQLKSAGFEVFWFDITDGGPKSDKIAWVNQIKSWKLKIKYPFRHFIKANFPKTYHFMQQFNENKVEVVFEKLVHQIQPDAIHVFEMNLAGIPILKTLLKHQNIPLIYSSWGSDMFQYERFKVSETNFKLFLKRVNYLITDCQRDFLIAKQNGFSNQFLGVFPGNGGINIAENQYFGINNRKTIIIKGYEDGVGKAINVLKALKNINQINNYKMVVFSADVSVVDWIKTDAFYKNANIQIIERNNFLPNEDLLKIMAESIIYIGNSTSDGMPNTLLEAMSKGVFPIQSNPGGATAEIITHGENGFLIDNPNNVNEISSLINLALNSYDLIENSALYNINFINDNYNRTNLQPKIVNLYQSILN